MGRSSSRRVTTLQYMVSSASGVIKYLICQVASQKHVVEGSSNVMGGSFLWYVTTLLILTVIGIVVVEI